MLSVFVKEMVKSFPLASNYEIISRNSETNKKLSEYDLVILVPSDEHHPLDTSNVNTTLTPSAAAASSDSVTSLVCHSVVGEKLDWNFFEHFDQVDNQLRIEVLHVPKYLYLYL